LATDLVGDDAGQDASGAVAHSQDDDGYEGKRPKGLLAQIGGHADEHKPGGRADEVHDEEQPELRRTQHHPPLHFNSDDAPVGRQVLPDRLDEVTLRWVAYEQRQESHHHPGDDTQRDHGLRDPFLDLARSTGRLEHIQQPGGQRRQHHGRKPEARHHDAGDEAGALGREPLEGCRRGGRVTQADPAACHHTETDDVGGQGRSTQTADDAPQPGQEPTQQHGDARPVAIL